MRGLYGDGVHCDSAGYERCCEYLSRFRYFADEPGCNVTLRLKWPFGKSDS